MDLRKTLTFVHDLFEKNKIDHALIGGLAMVNYGVDRSTVDVDLIIDEVNKENALNLLLMNGFILSFKSDEVLQFSGLGYLDLLIARRPISKEMLKNAQNIPEINIKCLQIEDIIGLKIQAYSNDSSREFQDKADIQFLLEHNNVNWKKIKEYADLFNRWSDLEDIKKKINV